MPVVHSSESVDAPRSRRREKLLEGENEVLKLLLDRAPLPVILDTLTQVAERQASGGLLASILLLDSDRIHLRRGSAPSLPAEYNAAIDGIAIGPNVGSCGTAAYLRTQVIVSDILNDPLWAEFRSLAARHGLRACWSTPILSPAKTVLGTFALYYREPRTPSPEDQETIEILTRTAALAIEHSRAEQQLFESEERFRSLSRCAPLGVFMTDAAGAFVYVNPRFIEIAGFEYEKTLEYWLERATGQSEAVNRCRTAMAGRAEFSGEFTITFDGVERPVSLRMAPLRSGAGEYIGYVGTLEDLSTRVLNQLALDNETRLRKGIEDSIPAGIAAVSPHGTQTYVNRAFADMVGWPAESLVGKSAPFVYWPEDQRENIEAAFAGALAGQCPRSGFELCFQRRNGERFDALVSIAPLAGETGGILGWVASVSDISERKRADQELARSEARLAMALDAGRLGAWEWDIASGRVSWSHQLEAIHGLKRGTFAGTFEDFQSDMNPDDKPKVLEAIQQALSVRGMYEVEYEIIRPDNSRRTVQARGRVFCDAAGNPEKMAGICMDITESRAASA